MEIVVVVLLAGIVLLSLFVLVLKREIRRMTAQLRVEPERKLSLSLFDKNLSAFASAVNAVIQRNQERQWQIRSARKQWENEIVNISHDLRTPLTSVTGYLQLLQSTPLTEEQEEYVSITRRKAVMLNGLVQDFFDLAYYSSEHRLPDLQPIRLADSVAESLLGFVAAFEEKGMIPCMENADETACVIADAEMASRVWHNIIENVLVHGGEMLEIVITRDEVRFENDIKSDSLLDTDRVFDRFYSADSSRKQGSGVGLTIVKALVQGMGGTVSAERVRNRFVLSVRLQSVRSTEMREMPKIALDTGRNPLV